MKPEVPVLFTDSWNTYQKVVRSNFMLHDQFGAHTLNYLMLQAKKGPLRILDMGCGDTGPLSKLLAQVAVAYYTGFDLSATALELCKQNLTPLGFPVMLKEGKMEELIENDKNSYDVVYSSFAIHHLSDERKKIVIRSVYDHLGEGGRFIFIDVYRHPGVSLEAYYESYLSNMHSNWHSLNEEEKKSIEEHIRNYDFPAYREALIGWCTDAGFTIEDKPDFDNWHQILVLKK